MNAVRIPIGISMVEAALETQSTTVRNDAPKKTDDGNE